MSVPGLVAAHVHLHQPHATLDQTTSQKARGTVQVAAVLRSNRRRLGRQVKRLADATRRKQRNGTLAVTTQIADRGNPIQMPLLTLDDTQQPRAVAQATLRHTLGQRQVRWSELGTAHVLQWPPLVVETVRTSTVHLALRSRVDHPRIVTLTHHSTKLARDDAAAVMSQQVGNHGRRRQTAAVTQQVTHLRHDRRVVGGLRLARGKTAWSVTAAGQHDVMTQRMIVRRM